MPLTPLQQHAVAMLSNGYSTSAVARDLDICRQTLCRWKRQPEFQRALDREVGEIMAGMNVQVQNTARVLVEGGLESAQQLRHMMIKPDTKDQERRISAQTLLKYAQRFWDLMGYNANLPKPRELCSEKLEELQDAEPIPDVLPRDTEPGDRDLRAECERDPIGPETHAGGEPDWYSEWRFSPIHDDGTPKPPPFAPEIPGAEPRDEVSEEANNADEPDEIERDAVIAVPASFVTRASRPGCEARSAVSFVVRAARPEDPNPTHEALAQTSKQTILRSKITPPTQAPAPSAFASQFSKSIGRTTFTANAAVTPGETSTSSVESPPGLQTAMRHPRSL